MKHRRRRYVCEHPVKVTATGTTIGAVICNVTSGGAKLSGVDGLEEGDTCTLALDRVPVPAVVRWVARDSAGLTFEQSLTQRQLERVSRVLSGRAGAHRGARRVWGYTEMG